MKTILIIEDNKDIRESSVEILELSGYHVLQAENGKIGVHLAIQQRPDLILCDIMMPEMDGYGVLYLLAKNKETAEIPFIFLTAKTDRTDFRKGMEMGADDYLTKPYDDMELLNAVEARINKHHRQHVHFESIFNGLQTLPSAHGDELKELISDRKLRHVKKKQILYYEGDTPQGLYLVLEGVIKTIKIVPDGRQLITGLYKSNDYIGMDALVLDQPFKDTAEAVEHTSFYLIPKELVINLINKSNEVSRQFIRILCQNVHEKEEQLLELAYLSVRKRLAQVLIRLSKKSPDTNQLSISREELAELAGVAIESVSRTLTDFKTEGMIEKNGSFIQLMNMDKLSKIRN
ncbi:response regulator [Pedobacter caeni]|uniref:cAMP-binding domain of CRP or a regulatory subunit of cAMP-dependent protein kinases n=1 Tax=Pedobacter caeni TaxID=288992 RepID=A0A1M5BBJ5_9SPHI|nr:response regulator [Pedobacter caeni]SHF39884.1 cAMP-binding domain of CRP or a regulatory subunit of cAMP-dependent protein kinases [Pedobacter caeni]